MLVEYFPYFIIELTSNIMDFPHQAIHRRITNILMHDITYLHSESRMHW